MGEMTGDMTQDDRELVHEARQGKDAFGRLVQKYQHEVFRVVYRIVRNQADAEDLTQEAFLKAYEALATYDETRPFAPWLMRIAVNASVSFLRHHKRFTQVPLAESDHPMVIEESLSLNDFRERVHQLVAQLKPEFRVAFSLYHYEQLSYEQMSDHMGLPVTTVRNYLFRARQTLKKLVEQEVAAS